MSGHSIYDELCDAIFHAQEEMLKENIEANSVTLNGRKYWKIIPVNDPYLKPTIFGMAVSVDYTMPDSVDFTVQYVQPKPRWKMTNGDKIRAMSDEELATWLGDMLGVYPFGTEQWNREKWLDWLKEEVEE